MNKLMILLLTIGMSSGVLAAKKDSAADETKAIAESGEKAEKEELICTKTPVTGSHMKKKTCRTKSQAEDERKRSRAYIERLRTQAITQGDKS